MLTEQQLECIEYLCVGTLKKTEIAERLGCSDRTIRKWKKENEEFKAELQKRTAEFESGFLDDAKSLIARTLGKSIENIIGIANNKDESAEVRLKANKCLLDKLIPDAKLIQDAKEFEKPIKIENINELAAKIKEKQKKKQA